MKTAEIRASDWWAARRPMYNLGLIVSGLLAFVAYIIVGSTLLPSDVFFEVTVFTTLVQAIGYMFMMVAANLLYFIGPISETFISPADPERYRSICFRLGFWVSVALPFSVPVLMAVLALY